MQLLCRFLSIPLWSYFNTPSPRAARPRGGFQSHFGLISTNDRDVWSPLPRVLSIPLWSYFNPAGVWGVSPKDGFQSHFGLISTIHRINIVLFYNQHFQSHFGLISTWRHRLHRHHPSRLSIPLWSYFNIWASMRKSCRDATFNPTLVLFQRGAEAERGGKRVIFQSHFGLISTGLWRAGNTSLSTFNPTLVLFQPNQRFNASIACPSFQSHFGLISTELSLKLSRFSNIFQSHFGLISTRSQHSSPKQIFRLSIPLWSYFNWRHALRCKAVPRLSIPLWSYFNSSRLT